MGVLDSLRKWFSAVTDPLSGSTKVANDLNSAHQDFMRGFASSITAMMAQQVAVKLASTATADMSGDGADAIVQEAMTYLQVSVSVTPTPGLVLAGAPVQAAAGIGQGATEVSQLTEFGELSAKAVADIEEALQNAGVQIGEDAGLDTVTEVVDGAAVAEAGANPIADAVALILTLITAFFFLKTLYDMAWAIYDAIQAWQKAATNATQPLPALPQKPGTPTTPAQPTLSQADKDLAKKLSQETGVPESVIEDIISKNPGLSEEQYRLLIQYYQKYNTIPYGIAKVFTMVNSKGKTVIAYVTYASISHMRTGHFEFDTLSDEEVAELIEELLQEQPDGKPKQQTAANGEQSTTYYYNDVEIDGKYYRIGIVVSDTKAGQIITIKTNQSN